MTKAVEELTTAGCSIHLIPDDNKHLYIHEKMLLTNDTTLITGSQNLSTASLLENRELSLKLDAGTAKPVLDAVASTFRQRLPSSIIGAVATGNAARPRRGQTRAQLTVRVHN